MSVFPIQKASRDSTIQQYLRRTAARGRDCVRIGPFLATFDRTTDHPFLSYAVPDDGAEPSGADVTALRRAYEERGRVPRLEYLPSVAPAAEAALVAGGFSVEARLAGMTCAPAGAVGLDAPAGVELSVPADDAELRAGLEVANEAFGAAPAASAGQVGRAAATLAAGGVAALARETASGRAVGWGQATAPDAGVTELGGIAVASSHRRRGIAGAITARLAAEAFARGVTTAFLTPGDAGAERVYARAGFHAGTEMLHLRV